VLRRAGVSLFLTIGILTLLFLLFPDYIYIMFSCHFFPLFICYHCVRYLYGILQWYWYIVVDFITFQVTLGLAYVRGVFFPRTYVVTFIATPFLRILGSRAWQ